MVDPKNVGDYSDPRYGPHSPDPEVMLYHARCVWHPRPGAFRQWSSSGDDQVSTGLRYIYDHRGDPGFRPGQPAAVTVLIDEAKIVAPVGRANPLLTDLEVSGMGRGIGMWKLSQSVTGVLAVCKSQAVHVVSFLMSRQLDRKTLSNDLVADTELLGRLRSVAGSPRSEDHEFAYYRDGQHEFVGPIIL